MGISHVISLSKVPRTIWPKEHTNIIYSNFCWEAESVGVILNFKMNSENGGLIIQNVIQYIRSVVHNDGCIFLHSYEGPELAGAVIVAYLMNIYRWSNKKAIQYCKYKTINFVLPQAVMEDLNAYQKLLSQTGNKLSKRWKYSREDWNYDEQILTITFINSRGGLPGKRRQVIRHNPTLKVRWGVPLIIKESDFEQGEVKLMDNFISRPQCNSKEKFETEVPKAVSTKSFRSLLTEGKENKHTRSSSFLMKKNIKILQRANSSSRRSFR